jgi:hypothetical protein
MAVLALVVSSLLVAASSAYGGGSGDYCEQAVSDGTGGDYCECPSGDAVPEYCQHQPPEQGETRVLIRGHKLKLTPDKRLWVELRCSGSSGSVCRGNLYLRARRLIGSKDFRIDAGSSTALPVRVSFEFARELEKRGRVPVSAVARQDGVAAEAGTTVKRMVAVPDGHR